MPIEAVVARAVQILLALAGAYLVALWFVLAVWAYRDIESRSRNVLTQVFSTLLVVLFWVPGVLLYLILRPKETLDGAYQRSLEEEYLLQDLEELPLCPSCERYVEDDFVLCPHCHTRLREPCLACAKLIDLRWSVCAYCGAAQGGESAGKTERVEEPAARWRSPVRLRRSTGESGTAGTRGDGVEDVAAVESEERGLVAAAHGDETAPSESMPAVASSVETRDDDRIASNGRSEVREPIPLVPAPRGRFGRAGADRPPAPPSDREPESGRELVSASGPFTSILGSRTQENGRFGGGGTRGRRAGRQLERVPNMNGSANGKAAGPTRPEGAEERKPRRAALAETADAEQPAESAPRDIVAIRAEGKGD